MARKKRTLLPAITLDDIAHRSASLRKHAHGWAWKCVYCGQFASSETLAGHYVCRSHGGVTARQRDPQARDSARRSGKPVPQPPGRPLKSGWYSRRAQVRVDEIVADYQARRLNADCTDEDMLYLRAHLEELRQRRPEVDRLSQALQRLTVTLESTELTELSQGPPQMYALAALMRETRSLWKLSKSHTEQIEERHARLIRLSKVRAETHLKNSAADQFSVFQMMLERFVIILREQLSVQDFAALQARIARDLAEVPADTLTGGAGIHA